MIKRNMHIIIPKGLSPGVINSQMYFIGKSYGKKFSRVTFWCSHFDRGKIEWASSKHTIKYYIKLSTVGYLAKAGDYFYFRSIVDYFYLCGILKMKNTVTVYDFRALLSWESYFRNGKLIRFIAIYIMELFAYRTSNQVYCVSDSMRIQLFRQYGKRPVHVRPALTNLVVSRQVDIKEKSTIKFVYVGGVSKWQKINSIIELFVAISEVYDAEFMFISNNKDYLLNILNRTPLSRHSVISCDNKTVLSHLEDCDFGILLRDDHIINKVASPIKFLEYLGAGVIPIISDNVGDYSSDVLKYKLGIVHRDIGKTLEMLRYVIQQKISD